MGEDLFDKLAKRAEERQVVRPPALPAPPKQAAKPEEPKLVTAYTEYRDQDRDYMEDQLSRINRRLTPKSGMRRYSNRSAR